MRITLSHLYHLNYFYLPLKRNLLKIIKNLNCYKIVRYTEKYIICVYCTMCLQNYVRAYYTVDTGPIQEISKIAEISNFAMKRKVDL